MEGIIYAMTKGGSFQPTNKSYTTYFYPPNEKIQGPY